MTTEGSTTEEVAATVLDVCIATPVAVAVYVLVMPFVALGTGVVRGFQAVGAYAKGERGLRLLAAANAAEQRRLEAAVRPFREVAAPVMRGDG